MNILIIGQCTLHWGRMEFGNIGNYYIIEPFIRELHATFGDCKIKTTFQMSERFCNDEKIEVVPMKQYYGWDNDLETANRELEIAREYNKTGIVSEKTEYINNVLKSDLIIDFSGDIWGDNADFLGDNRFYVGLCKNRVAQLFNKKTVMLAGSPGPFSKSKNLSFAREVFAGFDFVTNRESLSRNVLANANFDLSNLYDLSCPAFLFEPKEKHNVLNFIGSTSIDKTRPNVGFVICGWNFNEGPFDKWPRPDSDYTLFAEAIEYLDKLGANIFLMSHSNGFIPGKEPFELIHGRDYPISKQLQKIVKKRSIAKNVFALDGVYDTWTTKSIIGSFDILISGRVHAAVAGLSQHVPTVIIDYGHEPKAHKLRGFAIEAGAEEYVADPDDKNDILLKIEKCWNNRKTYHEQLKIKIPQTQEKAKMNFKMLKKLF